MALYELCRRPMRLWYSTMLAQAPFVPSPRNAPSAGSRRPGADRVLVVGNGPIHGWGVVTHGLSVVGQLAEVLSAASGRDVGVEFAGDERMTVDSAADWVGERAADGYDVVVVAIGLNDALRLTPVRRFSARYRALVARLRADLAPEGRVVLVTPPHATRYAMASGRFGALAERHAIRLAAVVRGTAVGLDGVHVLEAPIEHFEPEAPLGSPGFHRDYAEQLGDAVGPILEEARAARRGVHPIAAPSPAETVASAGDAELDRLVAVAKDRFGVAAAAVNLVDGDRIWSAAQTGGVPMQMPRSLVYCGVVADRSEELVVPDADRDPRFRDNAFLDVVQLPFYAGVPLRDPSGALVGTLCLLDGVAHDPDFVDLPDLRLLAHEAEARLAAVTAERQQEQERIRVGLPG